MRLLVSPASLSTLLILLIKYQPQKLDHLPTHKHKRHWAGKFDSDGTNPSPSFLVFVVKGSVAPV